MEHRSNQLRISTKILPLIVLLVLVAGCSLRSTPGVPGYETVTGDPNRDTDAARAHNVKATELLDEGELDKAEAQLKAALASDLMFGPAHNNLGTVYMQQKKYYLAAWEYQYAIKLMPNTAVPRNNLGLVFEAVGRLGEAEENFEQARAIEPDNVEYLCNLARVLVRTNHKDDRTRQLLSDIVLKDTRPQWTSWARERLALMGQPEANDAPGDAD